MGPDEVIFSDLVQNSNLLKDETNELIAKIRDSCKKGNDEGFSYIWIDTVCTDKSSSAELSQGINSMYAWYGKAQRCYAFLADVPADVDVRSRNLLFRKAGGSLGDGHCRN